jgi:hypothetical protein
MKLKYNSNYIGFGSSWVTVSPNVAAPEIATNKSIMTSQKNLLQLRKLFPKIDQLR